MCMPLLGVLGAVMSVAVGAASAQAEHDAKMADYQQRSLIWQQNVINAEAAARDDHRQIITKQLQEQEKVAQKVHVSYVEQAQKQATAEVQASASGVSGISLDNILDDIGQKSMLNRTYEATNYKFIVQDTQEQLYASTQKAIDRINSVPRPQEPADTRGIQVLGALAGAVGSIGKGMGGGSSGASLSI
jgi:hypothetical protein